MHQYFVDEIVKDTVLFKDDQTFHITRVLRKKVGDKLRVVYKDKTFLVEILENSPSVKAIVLEEIKVEDNDIYIRLLPALIKKDKFEWLIQKACEFGVSEIIPIMADRSVARINAADYKKIERWNKIALEACQQCKRSDLVGVHPPIDFEEFNNYSADLLVVANETEDIQESIDRVLKKSKFKSINLVVGPEGGFTKQEKELLQELNYQSVSLGKRILRAESASIYLLNVVDYYLRSNDV